MIQTPFNLYLDLEPGRVADLETVSRASIAFAAAVREAAFVIDPSIEIQIGLVSGTEGSLNLQTVIKYVQSVKLPTGEKLTAGAIAIFMFGWFSGHAFDYLADKVWEAMFGNETFSEEQLQQIQTVVENANARNVAKPQIERVFRELEKDTAIKGVGATPFRNERPLTVIPRSEFPSLGGHVVHEEKGVSKRIRTDKRRIVLVSPVLLQGTKRKWRFLTEEEGEIAAPILDQTFVDDIASGKIRIPMRSGIELEVEMETTEELQNGVWVIIDRKILSVGGTYPRPEQPPLFPSRKPDETEGGSEED